MPLRHAVLMVTPLLCNSSAALVLALPQQLFVLGGANKNVAAVSTITS